MTIDPITLAVVRGRLTQTAEQMRIAMIRSAFSMIVKESGDAAASVFGPDGELWAQASGVPILLGAAMSAMQAVLDRFGHETMQEGDVFALNDPYQGGSHLPDIAVVAPVFAGTERVGFCCVVAHHVDLGGSTVGSLPVDATEIFHEGLRLPPVRLVHAGTMDPGLRTVLEANTRFPSELIGDIEAQIAACRMGAAGIQTLASLHGADGLRCYGAALIAASAAMTRTALQAIGAGPFQFVQHMDDDGVRIGSRLRIEVAVRMDGGVLELDFCGTCDQAEGPFNATRSVVLAAAYYVVRCITGSLIETNAGCFASIRLVLRPGSLVDPRSPAPVNARSTTFGFLVDVLFGALAQALPDRIPAGSFDYPNVSFGGTDPLTGRGFVFNETGCGGLGGRPGADGVDAFRSKAGNSLNAPIEATELETPLRVERYALRRDSGGNGRYRGGMGYEKVLRLLRGEATVSHRSERHTEGPYGLAGGQAGAPSLSRLQRADGRWETLTSKRVFRMRAGDALHLATAGGGGHGDARLRDKNAILRDIRDGKVSEPMP
jgi:N-methylhydantoinase B